MRVYLFPGQGVQRKGMGKELFDEFPELTEQADHVLGYSIRKLCLGDPVRPLDLTEYTQPALYTVNALHYEKLRREGAPEPDFLAGFSLGEYNALCAAGVFDFTTGLRLVMMRGKLMGTAKGGGMAAVVGLREDTLREIVAKHAATDVSIANYNTPTQFVLAGPVGSIQKLRSVFAKQPGLVMFTVLKTSGAFHSPHMGFVLGPFRQFLKEFEFAQPRVPVISNVTAEPYRHEDIPRCLTDQISHPVRWVDSIRYLREKGATVFEEIGQTGVLSRLIQQIPSESPPGQSAIADASTRAPLLGAVLDRCDTDADNLLQIYHHGDASEQVTGRQIAQRARRLGSALISRLEPQAKVLLLLPQKTSFGIGLLACWYANVIAIPMPVTDCAQFERKRREIEAIAASSGARHVLTDGEFASALVDDEALEGLTIINADEIEDAPPITHRPCGEDELALVLYTSGSTSLPKGVTYSHRTLFHSATSPLWGMSNESRVVTWLPQFHAFGICCGLMAPLVRGALSVVYSPERFVDDPASWFRLIDRHQATHTGAPNFAFRLCCETIRDEDLAGLSLVSLNALICGGDIIQLAVYEAFVERFARLGLKADVLSPNYGLSEAGPITLKQIGEPIASLKLDSAALEMKQVRRSDGDAPARIFVSSGKVRPPTRILIVNPDTLEPCGASEVGEVWIKSPCVTQGYLDDPQASARTFNGTVSSNGESGFLRSGDLGFLDGDELYLVGREKDVIIVNGKNHHPVDIEASIRQQIAACHLPTAVFAVEDEQSPKVVVVQELDAEPAERYQEIAERIISAVSAAHRLEVHDVVLIPPGSLPVTGSRKIRRAVCRTRLHDGSLPCAWRYQAHGVQKARDVSVDADPWLRSVRERVLLPVLGERCVRLADTDPFTILGLDSLNAIRLARKVEEVFGVRFVPSMLYEYGTCQALSAYVADAARDPRITSSAPTPDDAPQPLSEGQKGLWALHKIEPGTCAYNVPTALYCRNGVSLEALQEAYRRTLGRHAMLRAAIYEEQGAPYVRYRDLGAYRIETIDTSGISHDNLVGMLWKRAKLPFDMTTDPLITLSVYAPKQAGSGAYLLIVAHHLVLDGSSTSLFLRDLFDAYQSCLRGDAADSAVPHATYHEYVEWERQTLSESRVEQDRAFWRKVLADSKPIAGLPLRSLTETEDRHEGEVCRRVVPGALAQAARAFAQTHQWSEGLLYLAVFKLLLYRYTGQDDLLIGMPVSNRPQERFDPVIGHFVNMLPIRSVIRGDDGFAAYGAHLRQQVLEALDHRGYPFARMVKDAGATIDRTHAPLFDISYNYQNFFATDAHAALVRQLDDALAIEMIGEPMQTGEYGLVLDVCPSDALHLNFKYDPRLFSGATVERLADHFCQLLSEALQHPTRALNRLSIVSEAEKQTVHDAVNQTDEPFAEGDTCYTLFQAQARVTPEAPAVSHRDQIMTYGELDRRIGQLAARMREAGIASGNRVGISVDRSIDLVAALLAIMKLGATYVPLDPDYPAERLAYIAADAECQLIVTHSTLRAKVESFAAASVGIVELDTELPQAVTDHADPAVDGDALAYILYTSGSTGKPKGVAIRQRSVTNLMMCMKSRLGFAASDTWFAVTTFGFDIAALELFLPLIAGGHCIIGDAQTARDAMALRDAIATIRPTFMQATPTTWAMLFRVGWTNSERTQIVCGGEALSEPLRQQFIATGSVLWNCYGPTETTIWSTLQRITADGPISIGKPLANTRVYILDRHLQPLPVGVAGELYIAGAGVAQGYYRKSELTAERFLPSPFRDGDILYRTGDQASWNPDGTIDLIGRIDNQVKLRGHRIELGEVERVLCAYPGIDGAVVVVKGAGAEAQLVAYVQSAAMRAIDVDALRDHLSAALPSYMHPARFIGVDAFPQTPNGKVDRQQTAAFEGPPLSAHASTPRGQVEGTVRQIFESVLKQTGLGLHQGFFEIGGDSFSAISVIEQINRSFACDLRVTSLFKHSTIDAFSAYLQGVVRPAASKESPMTTPAMPSAEVRPTDADWPDYYDSAIAIVGMSCQLPGAGDPREFWQNLLQGKDNRRFVPEDELHRHGLADTLVNRPGYVPQFIGVDNKDAFDATFFNISPRDAQFMDPQARMLLQHAWKAIEDAGYDVREVSDTSVFMSASNNFYQALLPDLVSNTARLRVMGDPDEYIAWVLAQGGSIPTMISNKLGLVGPSLYINTNCSSSLTSLHLACQSLLSGETRYALVGAATLFPATSLGYVHQPGLHFSSDGRCKAFDAAADGMVGGEGAAVVMLKRAGDAIKDGDHIYALLRGISVNNDGSDKVGFYAPSINGQAQVIRKALEKTGVHPDTIGYVEAHGTGTRIGDSIEIAALTEAWRGYTRGRGFCGIGSVKTNIGHLDAAAGLAGLIKLALCLEHGQIPASLNYQRPHADLELEASPFYVVDRNTTIKPGKDAPYRTALSSFGIGGTNAHAILEQYVAPREQESQVNQLCLVPLSAQNAESRADAMRALLNFLPDYKAQGGTLAALACTLQTGRRPMAFRAAFVVSNFDALEQALRAALTGSALPQGCVMGTSENGAGIAALFDNTDELNGLVDNWVRAGELHKIAPLWAAGSEIDWNVCYGGHRPRRISLPTYCFAARRYWIEYSDRDGADVVRAAVRDERRTAPAPVEQASTRSTNTGTDVERVLVQAFANALNMQTADVERSVTFADYGLDSLRGVALVKELNDVLGIDLDVTRIFDYPTVASLAAYIDETWHPAPRSAPDSGREHRVELARPCASAAVEPAQPCAPAAVGHKEPIAIVGFSGRFPQSDDAETFWRHLERGDDLMTKAERWNLDGNRGACTDGGFLDGIDQFDSLFFNISGLEATYMEPQQRLFLEECWKALENAGYAGDALGGRRCGVYVGCAAGDYLDLTGKADYPAQAMWGNMSSVVASRISYYLNLQGPALAVDTACSSSLVAIHLACQALWSGESEVALSGGVFLQCSPRLYISGSRAGMLSPSGRCRPFDDRADGFAPSEGVGVLVLKKLSAALADGDHVHGVIRGTGINQDGATNGITAPSANSQQRLIEGVYDEFDIDCGGIQMIEAHGTGTKLGDPIEFQALSRAFSGRTDKRNYCALGSSKANIGHAQMAAGVLGVIKILLAMKYQKIPPLLHFSTLNRNIALEGSPFYINTTAQGWAVAPGERRRAAISSFGASGTNAHLVIEEGVSPDLVSRPARPWLVVLSARSAVQLRQQMLQLAKHCRCHPDVDVADVAYTLLVGRKHLPRRVAVFSRNATELADGLERIAAGEACEALWNNQHDPSQVAVARDFIEGRRNDLGALFEEGHYRRLPLPTYPFERSSHWLPEPTPSGHERERLAPAVNRQERATFALERVSDDGATLEFSTTFSGNEYFLRDHRIGGKSVLPGAVYAALANLAFLQTPEGARASDAAVSLRNIALLRPFSVDKDPARIRIQLVRGNALQFTIDSYPSDSREAAVNHCRGDIAVLQAEAPQLDLPGLRAAMKPWTSTRERFYDDFRAFGIDYGSTMQGVAEIHVDNGSVLARIALPDLLTGDPQNLAVHPTLIDSAMQCLKYLYANDGVVSQVNLLFAIQEIQLHSPCASTMWAWLRFGSGAAKGKIDVDLCDERGAVCVAIRGISTRAAGAMSETSARAQQPEKQAAMYYLPTWDPLPAAARESWPDSAQRVIIIGGAARARELWCGRLPAAQVLDLAQADTDDDVLQALSSAGEIDHLIWLSEDAQTELPAGQRIIADQTSGVMQLFRLVKALLKRGYANRPLGMTVVVHAAQAFHPEERNDPTHAAVGGLIGTVAKECPRWRVRSVDVDAMSERVVDAVLNLSSNGDGDTHLLRCGQWFQQRLMPANRWPQQPTRVRQGGVYVIVGGAGGLGLAISEYLVQRYQARVIWLGRRAVNAEIDAAIARIALLGPAPCYIQADACDGAAMKRARAEIEARYGFVSGLIQSAMVLDAGAVGKMSETQFAGVLKSKVDASVHLVETFADAPLDFVLFISSINSYMKTIGQSNYAAACAFKDAYGQRIARELSCAAKVINLSYCFNNADSNDNRGAAISTPLDFIERDEFLAAIEALLASDLPQMTLMKPSTAATTRGIVLSAQAAHVHVNDEPSWFQEKGDELTARDPEDTAMMRDAIERMKALNELLI
ncbi:non-ribosomal peptide synthetase/type I polyketide synthase [Burkholderia glumae]|uniref:non-ribosomal peptide synthetase/type I polyketide synthase n=1 Tax=Burkholderia glumae TaxID=337 RepID=UPI00214F918C|nr:non-ribosomal peptide synthetase/type I polyketide synthase [Burkholderia glumae]MCM2496148.1 ACP S-malonyltransferase [Burkholderia glumae]